VTKGNYTAHENLGAVLEKDGEIATLDPLDIVAVKDLPPKKNGASKH